MPFTANWDESKPAGTRSRIYGDDDIREFKVQVRERLAVDHYALSNEGAGDDIGFHKKVTLLEQSEDPQLKANALHLYSKLSGSYAELFVNHENDGPIQWSRNGKLSISALSVASEADGDLLYRSSGAWGRLALGSSLQYVRVNAGGTGLEYATLSIPTEVVSGLMMMWPGDLASPPSGWLLCDGSTFSSITYPDLATAVGDRWGTHSGTTYYLPNMTNAFPYGASDGSDAGNASVGSRKVTPATGHYITGNDNNVQMNFNGGSGYGSGGVGNPYPNYDSMAPYAAVGFIIKT